jgi:hypothetical protein
MIEALPKIGFWRPDESLIEHYPSDSEELRYPTAVSAVDESWTGPERDVVLFHVKNGTVVDQYRGSSMCRICGIWNNGSTDYSDGSYVWPEGYGHYIEKHAVKPPQEFIDHCLRVAGRK